MPTTNVRASLHENGLNLVLRSLMAARPFRFNHGTQYFRDNPDHFCEKIPPLPPWVPAGTARMTLLDPMEVPGTSGQVALDYSYQVTKLAVDFHPGNTFALPPELHLAPQEAALSARIAGTIVCPDADAADDLADAIAHPPPMTEEERRRREEEPPGPIVLPPGEAHCFWLNVYATAAVARKTFELEAEDGTLETHEELGFTLRGFEIEDISPNELENNIECFIATTIRLAVLPLIRLSLDAIVVDLGTHLDATITIPTDPSIQNDQLTVSVLVDVS